MYYIVEVTVECNSIMMGTASIVRSHSHSHGRGPRTCGRAGGGGGHRYFLQEPEEKNLGGSAPLGTSHERYS